MPFPPRIYRPQAMESESHHLSSMPPRTDRSEDEETSSLSDYDSEWTQVSGNWDDSDYPPLTAASDRPLSRADTIDGSIDGDVWEGFIDGVHTFPSQLSDETRPLGVDATDEAPHDAASMRTSVVSRASEDEIVNNALNSSFVGTLTASRMRSASSSLHASLTESQSKLRLSFPDPLSSREDLDSGPATQDVSAPTSPLEEHVQEITMEDTSSSFADIEAPSILNLSETIDEVTTIACPIPASASCILSLFLYGSASSSKWQVAEKVMALVLQRDGSIYSFSEEGPSRQYYFDCSLLEDGACAVDDKSFAVHVVDRTSNSSEVEFADIPDQDVPSLAILLLPARLPAVLPKHTFYLPLISPSLLDFGSAAPIISSTFSERVTIDSAHYTWKKLDLPKEDTIVLDRHRPHAILDVSALENAHKESLIKAFSVIFSRTDEIPQRNERLFANKWYKAAFVAATLIAIAVGGIQRHVRMPLPPTSTNVTSKLGQVDLISTTFKSVSALASHLVSLDHTSRSSHSSTRSIVTIISEATARSTLTSAIHESKSSTDAARSAVATIIGSSSVGKSSSETNACRSKARSWANKLNLSLGEYIPRDLIVLPANFIGTGYKDPTTQTPSEKKSSESSDNTSGDKASNDGVKSLSLRAVNSLAGVSCRSKALMKVAGKDMSVVYEAIDNLLHALGRQVDAAKVEMKDAKSLAQSVISFRNARAKENARRLRRAGECFIKAAGDRLRSRGEGVINIASHVRESAQAVRQEVNNLRQSRGSQRRKAKQLREPKGEYGNLKDKKEHIHEKNRRGGKSKYYQRRPHRARMNDRVDGTME